MVRGEISEPQAVREIEDRAAKARALVGKVPASVKLGDNQYTRGGCAISNGTPKRGTNQASTRVAKLKRDAPDVADRLAAIWLHPDGSILDGRNRYRACLDAGVKPRFETWEGTIPAADFVWSLNFTRRHLDGGAKQMAAGRYAIELEREARQRSGTRTDLTSAQICAEVDIGDMGRSREKAAEKFDVAPRTIDSAVKVLKEGAPALVKAVESGVASVSAAADIAKLPEHRQIEIVARGRQTR